MTKIFNVQDYGAVANSTKVQTNAFQRCIDACCQQNGGTIVVPNGNYIIGSIQLFSNITLLLKENSKLIGSSSLFDYTDFGLESSIQYYQYQSYRDLWNLPDQYFSGIIVAHNAENIAIIGESGSSIDGQNLYNSRGEEGFRGPMTIVMSRINGLKLGGYTVKNAANWSHCLDSCQDLKIQSVTVLAGHDGFNLHHSRHVRISNCTLLTGDDCIAGYDISDLIITDCRFNTACNVLRIGGKDIQVRRCENIGPGKYPHLSTDTYNTHAFFKYPELSNQVQHY